MRKFFLPAVMLVLGWGFWISPEFMRVSAGVAIFMFGMLSLEQGFQAFTGGALERVLGFATRTRWRSLGFGLVTTTLMQSSSLVTLLSITFLSAGLISLAQGIGIIFGSNIGTTTGAWLMAGFGVKVDIAAWAMPMLVFGIMLIFRDEKRVKAGGNILFGVSLLFLGIANMKAGFESLSSTIDLARFAMPGYPGLFLYAGIGILATVVMQSSHAVLMLTIAALVTGQVSYENGLGLAIGANVGTTITAILGALNANAAGRRLAGAHLIFNLTTGVIAIIFIGPLTRFVDAGAAWIGLPPDEYAMKLALFHTVFNLLGVGLMMPLVGWMVGFLTRVVQEKPTSEAGVEQPRYLSEAALEFPDAALVAMLRESRHLGFNVMGVLTEVLRLKPEDILSDRPLSEIVAERPMTRTIDLDELYRTRIEGIYSPLVHFAARSQAGMDAAQIDKVYALRKACRHLVEGTHTLRLLNDNLEQYARSGNPQMMDQLNRLRAGLASLLRAVAELREETDVEKIRAALEALKSRVATANIEANAHLDHLIRDSLVTEEIAGTLMNDHAYAFDVLNHLLKAAETIVVLRAGAELPPLPDSGVEEEDSILARRHELLDERPQGEVAAPGGGPTQ
jgi:phosphate:Na+ symporter